MGVPSHTETRVVNGEPSNHATLLCMCVHAHVCECPHVCFETGSRRTAFFYEVFCYLKTTIANLLHAHGAL